MDISNILVSANKLATDPKINLAKSIGSALFSKKKSADNVPADRFSLSAFSAELHGNGFRLSKGYYYIVNLNVNESDMRNSLTFNCNKVTLPGWKAKTQTGKVYGLPFEIATELEQDAIYLTFNIDIMHSIEQYFLDTRKQIMFDVNSYSPHYKRDYQFNCIISVTDENFIPQFNYTLENSMFKTMQNVNYGAGQHETSEITVELSYETLFVTDVSNNRPKVIPSKAKGNPNLIHIGPFSATVGSLVNTVNNITNVPSWFSGATKI